MIEKSNAEKIHEIISSYKTAEKDTINIIGFANKVINLVKEMNSDMQIDAILNDVIIELLGLTTENLSQKDLIFKTSTVSLVKDYMVKYINDVEKRILTYIGSKFRYNVKIKKFIDEYIALNFFKRIMVVSLNEGIIQSVNGEEYTLTQYFAEILPQYITQKDKTSKILSIYKPMLDESNVNDLKIAFRKSIVDKVNETNLLFDFWKELSKLIQFVDLKKISDSLTNYELRKSNYHKEAITPIINLIEQSDEFYNEEFKIVYYFAKKYYCAPVKIFEDDYSKFEYFILKLYNCGFIQESELLENYLENDISLLTDKVIEEKFVRLNKELANELLNLNKQKFSQTCIGYIILSDIENMILNHEESVKFIIALVLDSIFKMTKSVLTSNNEFLYFQKLVLSVLQQIAELKDLDIARHQARVTVYTEILAESLMKKKNDGSLRKIIADNGIIDDTDYLLIDNEYVRDLLYSAQLHDLGKIGITDSILKNKNRLSDEEFEVMKLHTIYGRRGLNVLMSHEGKKTFLLLASSIAENHHERWDGSGYPNNKKAFEIPLSARILSIADVYDALRKERPYKKSFSHEQATDVILNGKGKHFDPVLADIFKENSARFNDAFIHLS